ncbi:MAG: ABC transporter permease [Candidatus Korobacteraceae bacterium]
MGTLGQDFRYGLRMLRKSPGFTAVAVLTLALAIGAVTAIFSALYPVLLRSLPFRDPDRLVTLGESRHRIVCCSYNSSYPDYLDWTRTAKSFQALAGSASDAFTLTGNGDPKSVFSAMVTLNFFSTLGVTPVLGRDFIAGEDLPDGQGPTVAILSNDFWRSDFAADPKIIGRIITLDKKPVTVVGVLPRDFEYPPAGVVPIWVPLHTNPYTATTRNARWLNVIGRLAPGVSLAQARAEMTGITAQLAAEYPRQDKGIAVTVGPLREQVVGDVRPFLLVLFGAVSFLLLIACANVAGLLLARSVDRRKEFAIRTALGASRVHLLFQLLIESLLLSLGGAILGFLGAAVGLWLLLRSIPEAQLDVMPYLRDIGISFPVLAFVCGITLLTAVLFGIGPGMSVPQTPLAPMLNDESRGGTSGTQSRVRNVLVIGEIAISLVLLAGGGLMLHSLLSLLRQNPGFEPAHLLTFGVNLPGASYPVSKTWPYVSPNGIRFEHEFTERLRNLPGVVGVTTTNSLPVAGNTGLNRFLIEGRAAQEGQEEAALARRVDPHYLEVMKIPLLKGRFLASTDTADTPKVLVVNQAWLKREFPDGEDPLGKRVRLTFAPEEPYREIVGVIGDVAEDSLAVPPPPTMYFPIDQDSGHTAYLNYLIRTTGDPAALVPSARAILLGLDPQLAAIQPQSMDDFVNGSPAVFLRRFPFYLIGSFATLALILAMIGLYGLISYSVLQRTREIGIRMALGAQPNDILKLMLRQGIKATVIGVVIGLVCSLAFGRVMASLLYGAASSNWLVFVGVALMLLLIALVASYIPSRKAAELDPMTALRNE